MKTFKNQYYFVLLLLAMSLHPLCSKAQYYDPQSQVEKKVGDPQRQKGRDAIHKQVYENDKRYKDPTNKVQATIVYQDKELKKNGDVKKTINQKMVFGKNGECIVINDGDKKGETWMIYNYADKANYVVNVRDKTAMKMPLINMQKMIGHGDDGSGTSFTESWVDTGIKQNINGYNCEKFTYTYASDSHYSTMDAWISSEVKINLGNDYMFGERLNQYKLPAGTKNKGLSDGFMVRAVFYDKKNNPVLQRDLIEFDKTADEKYFDMSQFKVTDIIDQL
jgi:Domain of unknown function (DUF4412)